MQGVSLAAATLLLAATVVFAQGDRLFCLSIHPLMTGDDLEYITGSVREGVAVVRA